MKTNFNEFLNENNSTNTRIKKGDMVKVKMTYFQGSPVYEVEAETDSWYNDKTELFTYRQGGDMMLIAKWNGKEWLSS